MKWDAQERGAGGVGAVTWVKQMEEAHALGRTNNISGARSSAIDAEGMAMTFVPPADAKKRPPCLWWGEEKNSVQMQASQLEKKQRDTPTNQ